MFKLMYTDLLIYQTLKCNPNVIFINQLQMLQFLFFIWSPTPNINASTKQSMEYFPMWNFGICPDCPISFKLI